MTTTQEHAHEHTVDFLGYQIHCIQADDGSLFVPLKGLCAILGIDHNWQRAKVKNNTVFSGKVMPVPDTDGRHRHMFCLPAARLHSWLFAVNSKTVRPPEIVVKLLDHQDESRIAMRHCERYGLAVNPRKTPEELETALRESLERLMAGGLPNRRYPKQRRSELLRREIALLEQFKNEAPPYRDKANASLLPKPDMRRGWPSLRTRFTLSVWFIQKPNDPIGA